MILGVLYHALVFVYLYQEPASLSEFLAVVFLHQLIHTFRMPAFFLVAGFFALLLIDKRGGASFIRNRLLRIGVPFLIFWQPMVVLNAYSSQMGWYGTAGYPPPSDLLPSDDTQHLWFLYFLIIFSATLWAITPLIRRMLAKQPKIPLTTTLLGLAMLTPLIPGAVDRELATSTRIVFDPGVLGFYFLALTVGAAVYVGRETLVPALAKNAIAYCAGGLTFFAFFFISQDWGIPQSQWFYSLTVWLLTAGVIGVFLRFATKERPIVRFLSDGSYWLYLIHLPLVFMFLVLGSEAELPVLPNVLVTFSATLFFSYVSYKAFVRSTFLGLLLNGRRYPFSSKVERSAPR